MTGHSHWRSIGSIVFLTLIGSVHAVHGEVRPSGVPSVRSQLDIATRSYTDCVVISAQQRLKEGEARGVAGFTKTKCEPAFLRVERTLLNLTKDRKLSRRQAERIRSQVFITVGAALLAASASRGDGSLDR